MARTWVHNTATSVLVSAIAVLGMAASAQIAGMQARLHAAAPPQTSAPPTPAAALVRRAHARARLEQGGGAVMAVGVHFLFQRPWQFGRGLAAPAGQLRHQRREPPRQHVVDQRNARGGQHTPPTMRTPGRCAYLGASQRLLQLAAAFAS